MEKLGSILIPPKENQKQKTHMQTKKSNWIQHRMHHQRVNFKSIETDETELMNREMMKGYDTCESLARPMIRA